MDALPAVGVVACLVIGLVFFFLGIRLVTNADRRAPAGTLGLGFAMMIAGLGLLVITSYALL